MAVTQSVFTRRQLTAAELEQWARSLSVPCEWDGFGWFLTFDGNISVWLEEGTEDIEDMPKQARQASKAGGSNLAGRVAVIIEPADQPDLWNRIAQKAADQFNGCVLHDHRQAVRVFSPNQAPGPVLATANPTDRFEPFDPDVGHWDPDGPETLPDFPVALEPVERRGVLKSLSASWLNRSRRCWPEIEGRGGQVALIFASDLLAALSWYNARFEDAGDMNVIANLLFDHTDHLTKLHRIISKEIDPNAQEAVFIVEEMLLPECKYYVGVAHTTLIRTLRLDEEWDTEVTAAQLPAFFATQL